MWFGRLQGDIDPIIHVGIKTMDDLRSAARIAVKECMAIKPGEKVLIITDEPLREIGYVLWEASKELDAEAIIAEITPRRSHGEEPPGAIIRVNEACRCNTRTYIEVA